MKKLVLHASLLTALVFGLQSVQNLGASADERARGRATVPLPARTETRTADGLRNIADAVQLLSFLFQGGPPPVAFACETDDVPALELRLDRESLDNVDDAAGRFQHSQGRVFLGRRIIGSYVEVKRVTFGNSFNAGTHTLTLFFSGSSGAPENITLQGTHDFGSGERIGSVSAASSEFCDYIGKRYRILGDGLVIGS